MKKLLEGICFLTKIPNFYKLGIRIALRACLGVQLWLLQQRECLVAHTTLQLQCQL